MQIVSPKYALLANVLVVVSSFAHSQERLHAVEANGSPYDFVEIRASSAMNEPVRYESVNAAQRTIVAVSENGLSVTSNVASSPSWRFGLQVASLELRATAVTAHGPAVEVERGPISEWYVSSEWGVEQGFSVARALGRPLAITLNVIGDLTATAVDAQRITFATRSGEAVLHYGAIAAFDSDGRTLPASRRLWNGSIVLEVDDSGASYPITIDPLITTQEQKLTDDAAVDPEAEARFGYSVAVGSSRIVVGSPLDSSGVVRSGAVYVFEHDGTSWILEQKLQASDPQLDDRFGASVGYHAGPADGDRIVIGAPGHEVEFAQDLTCPGVLPCCTPLAMACGGGSMEPRDCAFGAAYVFRLDGTTWTQEAQLFAERSGVFEGEFNDHFGEVVAIRGDTIAIGARFDEEDCENCNGAPGCFDCPEFDSTTDCQPCWLDPASPFGACPGPVIDSGSVHVYRRSGTDWQWEAKLLASDAARLDWFGSSIALDGETIVVGARRKNQLDPQLPDDPLAGIGSWAGAAYVFERTGTVWSESDRLHHPGGFPPGEGIDAFDEFGSSVDVSGDTIVVGARYGDEGLANPGSAFVFRRGGTSWDFEQRVVAPDGEALDRFGSAVALDGDSLIVGARHHRGAGTASTGAAYLFERVGMTWSVGEKFTSTDGELLDLFGFAVDVFGGTAVVGAVFDDGLDPVEGERNSGSAYVFELSPFTEFCTGAGVSVGSCTDCPCGNNAPPGSVGGCLNSDDRSAVLEASGRPSLHDDTMQLEVFAAASNSFALLASGLNRLPAAGTCGGTDTGVANPLVMDGLRCVGGSFLRHGARATDSNGDGSNPWTGLIALSGFQCGETRSFQTLYRDALTACNRMLGTSNAVEVTIVP